MTDKENFACKGLYLEPNQTNQVISKFFEQHFQLCQPNVKDVSIPYEKIEGVYFKNQHHITFYLKDQKIKLQIERQNFIKIRNFLRPLLPQKKFKKHYEIEQILKQSRTSKVLKCKSLEDDQFYAIKFQNIFNKQVRQNEISILKHLALNSHPNIVQMVEYFIEDGQMMIVFPYLQGGTLLNLIKKHHPSTLPNQFNFQIQKSLLKGLNHLHQQRIIHRDLKFDNVMLEDENNPKSLKIIDFGLSTFDNEQTYLTEKCGTIGYIAPEILCNESYDQKCDVYSLGQIFYVLVTGNPSFQNGKSLRTITKLAKQKMIPNNFDNVQCTLMRELLIKMTSYQRERYSTNDCLNYMLFRKKDSISEKVQKLYFRQLRTPFQFK